jgi:MFS transporter, PAT family, beta-lactamase induction signal transducer AmpG
MAISEINKAHISSLSENPVLRYFTFIVLYFSQGIPEGITIFAIPAWMAMNGKSAAEIAGYSAVIIVPFSLKILLAPMMERYTYLPMGRRRPWLLFGQFGILGSLIALSFVPDPLDNIFLITIVAVCVHVFVMFQDIATDSLVIDIVPLEQQGKANSLMWGSKTIGTSVAMFVGSYLINVYGFSNAVLAMSVTVLLVMFVPLFLREREGEKLLPWTKGRTSPLSALLAIDSWSKLFRSFMQVVLLRNTILLLVAVYITMAAIHYMITLLPIFTIQEIGWNNVFYSEIFSSSNLVGGIIGMVIGGFVIQRFGIVFLIQSSLFLAALLAISMALSTPLWKTSGYVSTFVAVYCVLRTLIYIGVLALAMHLCWKRISAIQFTFCMTVFNAGLASGAALLGSLRGLFEWQTLFVVFAVMMVVSMIILRFIKTNRHREQVELLERDYVDVLKAEGNLLVKSETN